MAASESITAFLGEALRKQLDECAKRYRRPRAEIIRAALMHYIGNENARNDHGVAFESDR